MIRFFKVIRGFGSDDFIPIDESELEVAMYAHITGKTVILKNGSINGTHISAIMPDFHKAMGWRYGHPLKASDWEEIDNSGVQNLYKGALESAKIKIQQLMRLSRPDLIGKPQEELEAAGVNITIGIK